MAILRKLSIRSQLLILAASTIAVVLFIMLHTYSTMSGMITRNHEEYVNQTITEIRKNVTSSKDVIHRLMQNISYNQDVQSYLVEKDELVRYEMFIKLNKFLASQQEVKEGILDIVISGNNGVFIDLRGGNRYVSPLKATLPARANAWYAGLHVVNFSPGYLHQNALVFATKIAFIPPEGTFNNEVATNTNIGTLFFVVDPRTLVGEEEPDTRETNTQLYLLDRDRKVITGSRNGKVEVDALPDLPTDEAGSEGKTIDWNGQPYIMQTEPLPEIEGHIVSMAPKEELLRDLLDVRRQELLIFGLCLVVLAVPFMFIINNILRPLKKLIFFMTTIKRGDLLKFKKRISLQGYMEISIMAAEMNGMLDEIDNLTQRLLDANTQLYGTELEKKKSELAFLRSQINPHFLYNTLEAITGIAAATGQGNIKMMTRALSSIFRYSIKGADEVPLREEVRMVESYVQIQQMRFADRFSVQYELSESALAFPVPKMILQPLVENAVYHGFEPTFRRGLLRIMATVDEDGALLVVVEDDGIGIEPRRMEEIRGMLSSQSQTAVGIAEAADNARAAGPDVSADPVASKEPKSIGLVNVNNRLRLLYGQECGISIESEPGNGTRIRLRIADGRSREDA